MINLFLANIIEHEGVRNRVFMLIELILNSPLAQTILIFGLHSKKLGFL